MYFSIHIVYIHVTEITMIKIVMHNKRSQLLLEKMVTIKLSTSLTLIVALKKRFDESLYKLQAYLILTILGYGV